ncbi:hypothetical protein [Absidia glauca]|uniref:sn-1-specific diacylglycerol lipase n=1 Tax=Absidia glauca TaxID=4829 RepID=A0A168RC34_ABSGL|nr:hypothetical protein [Absidia glauca]
MSISSQIATCKSTLYETSPTLLQENVAGLITTASLATRVSLRCSSLIIDAFFEGAKYGTSVSLGLGRNALTNAISTTKLIHASAKNMDDDNEQYQVSTSDSMFLQLIDKYTGIGVDLISNTFTLAELFALSGLQFTSKTIKTGLKACEETVRLIDGIFGSTDTSRGIASIITLVHRELMHDPEFELAQMGKGAILASLTKALTALALLQTVTHQQRIKHVQSTVLWQGLVIEEETNQQYLLQMEHQPPSSPTDITTEQDTSTPDTDSHDQVIHELKGILAESTPALGDSSNNDHDGRNNMAVVLTDTNNPDSATMYEIITTTQRSTIKTTSIRPVDPDQPHQLAPTKYITLKSEEMDKEAFVARINGSNNDDDGDIDDDNSGQGIHGNKLKARDSTTGNSILLSAISKKLTRKKLERKESYGWESSDGERIRDGAHQPAGPTKTMTSTSTTLRSTASTSTSRLSSSSSNSNSPSPPADDHTSNAPKTPKKQKSRWGFSMDNIRQKKNNAISSSSFSIPFYPAAKKLASVSPTAPVTNRPSSSPPTTADGRPSGGGNPAFSALTSMNTKHKPRNTMKRSNSITSLASISRTTMTTTYSTTTPTPTPSCSSTSLQQLTATSSPPPSVPPKDKEEANSDDASNRHRRRRRVRLIRSMPAIRESSAPKSLDQEIDPRNFPRHHIISNIGHFMRYASAAYGESFMRIFGIGDMPSVLPTSHHPNHHAFAHHTRVSVQDILLSSYTDPSNILAMHHPSMHALVHYVTVDHHTKSIVLTCRGTLGLSDVLTDLSFTYTDFTLPTDATQHFQAHDGMLDAAQLLAKQKGKVYQCIRLGLEQYPDYGLVLCGHSLGGGVVSLLGVLWSQERGAFLKMNQETDPTLRFDPVPFVTSHLSGLPAGRPVHCYAYGPPCAMSFDLSQYCGQGLVTSVVHGYDIVPTLSWGIIKDLKNVATSLHEETHTAEAIISRIIGHYNNRRNKKDAHDDEEEKWLWATIKTMRADMCAEKLYPPSTVYHVESVPQLIQNHQAASPSSYRSHYRKAHMTTLSLCDDIHTKFSEITFSRSMFADHTPGLYEKAIRNLCRGFFGQEGAYETT